MTEQIPLEKKLEPYEVKSLISFVVNFEKNVSETIQRNIDNGLEGVWFDSVRNNLGTISNCVEISLNRKLMTENTYIKIYKIIFEELVPECDKLEKKFLENSEDASEEEKQNILNQVKEMIHVLAQDKEN